MQKISLKCKTRKGGYLISPFQGIFREIEDPLTGYETSKHLNTYKKPSLHFLSTLAPASEDSLVLNQLRKIYCKIFFGKSIKSNP